MNKPTPFDKALHAQGIANELSHILRAMGRGAMKYQPGDTAYELIKQAMASIQQDAANALKSE